MFRKKPKEKTPVDEASEESKLVETSVELTEPIDRDEQSAAVIQRHVLWAMGAGLVPMPAVDYLTVGYVQMDMLKHLAEVFDVDLTKDQGKAFVGAVTGTSLARAGASLIKAIPGIGTVIGGVSMSAMAGASTYAVGQVGLKVFKDGGKALESDLEDAKAFYREALERGKEFVSKLDKDQTKARDVFEKIRNLRKLEEEGHLTESEVEEKKRELLNRL